MRSLPLAFLFVESYERRRFLFLDLFVKWAVYYLLALACVLSVLHFALPRLAPLPLAIVLLPLLYLVPAVCRLIGQWLDRALLNRPLPALKAHALFLDRTQSASTEPALIEQATLALADIFRAPARIHLDAPMPRDPAVCTAIRSSGRSLGWITLDHRADRRPFFSQDYQLLDSLAAAFASALEGRRAQVRALHAQINPHFLFNSLNTIASLIHDDPDLAESTVLRLSGIFRHALDRARSEWTTLAVEFDFIADCIAVERARFGEFTAIIELPDDLRSFRIPSMALHILVENAFKHGLSKAEPPRRIEVVAERLPAAVRLRVADNGPGLDSEGRPPGRGLAILDEILARHYGGSASLSLTRDPAAGLTVAAMEIPA
jgi:signal transduction histidine kinase